MSILIVYYFLKKKIKHVFHMITVKSKPSQNIVYIDWITQHLNISNTRTYLPMCLQCEINEDTTFSSYIEIKMKIIFNNAEW